MGITYEVGKPLSFQSAPPAETRGDWRRTRARESLYSFQSAPPAETRGDACYCNQRNTKRLHRRMREPPFIRILLTKRRLMPRCNLLLVIELPTVRK